MAQKKKPSFAIGNCEVTVGAPKFTSESSQNSLLISLSRTTKIKISVVEAEGTPTRKIEGRNNPDLGSENEGYFYFSVFNPKDSDGKTNSFLKEVLDIYFEELPAMNYAANTGKESRFLEKCISNGKYCTLVLHHKVNEQQEEVVSAITYQIIPADTKYAEIPIAAVSKKYQKKGFGRLLYTELSKRLHGVGIQNILCWGDKESLGFWLKQGFSVIGEVDIKGRARRLPIKGDIRKALCFPGGSTLLVSHLSHGPVHSAEKLKLSFPVNGQDQFVSDIVLKQQPACIIDSPDYNGTGDSLLDLVQQRVLQDYCQSYYVLPASLLSNAKLQCLRHPAMLVKTKTVALVFQDVASRKPVNCKSADTDSRMLDYGDHNDEDSSSCPVQGAKKRVWEASCTSLKSKKIKGGHSTGFHGNYGDFVLGFDTGDKILGDQDVLTKKDDGCMAVNETQELNYSQSVPSTRVFIRVMLMNIADDKKITSLTKIIENLGGIVTFDGSQSTHIVTGKARKTLNFCIGLCSGAWIVSSGWLKESYRNGRFVDEVPFILKDEDYECKYRTELKVAVLGAKENPHSLLKGYDLCVSTHVQPLVATLTSIIKSAGGNIIEGLEQVKNPSRTIFIASEEDMEDVLMAAKGGIQTFSSDWLMNCIMRQQLDLDAPKFAESL